MELGADGAVLDRIDSADAQEMDATIDFAVAAEPPPQNSMSHDVFAPDQPEPEPLRARIERILAGQ